MNLNYCIKFNIFAKRTPYKLNFMKKTIFKIVTLLVVSVLLYSCYPNSTSIEDLDTATTIYEPKDFEIAPTSAIIYWDIEQLVSEDGNDLPYDGEVDYEILNTTLDNLIALYGVGNIYIYSKTNTPTPTPSNSDVTIITHDDEIPEGVHAGILPSILLRKNTSVGVVYPPCYPGYWGWYCYPPVVSVSSYDVGTIILNLVDLRKNEDTSHAWSAYVRGLPSSSSSFNGDRVTSGINQAFIQSPYLK